MITATEHALKLLTNWNARKGPTGEAIIVSLMLDDSHFSSIEERTQKILVLIEDDWSHRYSASQQSLAIEALTVLKFKHAERIQAYLLTQKTEIDKLVFLTGILGAHVWADESGCVNQLYQKRFPTLFGESLVRYVRRSLCYAHSVTCIDLERLENLLQEYLSAKYVTENKVIESARRCRLICATLNNQDLENISDNVSRVIKLVTRFTFETLSLNTQTELLVDAFKPRREVRKRLRFYTYISTSSPNIDDLYQTQFHWMDAKKRFVFASEEEAKCFAGFYEKTKVRNYNIYNSSETLRITRSVEVPIPKNSSGEDCEIVTEFSPKDVAILCEKIQKFYEESEIPVEQRHMPKIGTLFGAITFEWTPPNKKE